MILNVILSDFDLKNYIKTGRLGVEPFSEEIVRENGLDLRLGKKIARLRNVRNVFDIRNIENLNEYYRVEEKNSFIIKPYERVLLHTIEYLCLPPDIMGFVNLRSTYARLGLVIPPTIIDGGFEGQLTIELVGSSFPIKLYAGERFIHVVFAKLTSPIEKPYSGKYQGQKEVTLPRFFTC